jgi:hypothetical protein
MVKVAVYVTLVLIIVKIVDRSRCYLNLWNYFNKKFLIIYVGRKESNSNDQRMAKNGEYLIEKTTLRSRKYWVNKLYLKISQFAWKYIKILMKTNMKVRDVNLIWNSLHFTVLRFKMKVCLNVLSLFPSSFFLLNYSGWKKSAINYKYMAKTGKLGVQLNYFPKHIFIKLKYKKK